MSKISVIQSQSLFDIAIEQYGHVGGAYEIARDNDLALDADLTAGQVLTIPEWTPPERDRFGISSSTAEAERDYLVRSMKGQTIYDLALQEYGTVAAAFEIINNNPGIDMEYALVPGTEVRVKGPVSEPGVFEYYSRKGIKPASWWLNLAGDFNQDFSNDFFNLIK